MPDELTSSDYNSIVYFIREKGDVTRMSDWEKRLKPIILKSHPDLWDALERVRKVNRNLENELDKFLESNPHDD